MGAPGNAHWLAPLDRHRERRLQHVPTLSVLVGAPDAGDWVWASWHRRDSRKHWVASGSNAEVIFEQWLCSDAVESTVRVAVLDALAGQQSTSVVEMSARLSALGPQQLVDLVDRASVSLDCWDGILRSGVGLRRTTGRDLHDAFPRSVRSLSRLVDLPSLLLSPANENDALELARLGIEIAEAVPQLDTGLALSAPLLSRLKNDLRPGHLARFIEGVVLLRPAPGRFPKDELRTSVVEYDPVELARSSAERELYHHLERRTKTRGLFSLNGCIAARSEGADVEIDFLCDRLKLAVEVDGYHHFRDATAYRRDRRKDAELQLRGYVVVRVLAEDVSEQLEHVLETIDKVVDELQEREERP